MAKSEVITRREVVRTILVGGGLRWGVPLGIVSTLSLVMISYQRGWLDLDTVFKSLVIGIVGGFIFGCLLAISLRVAYLGSEKSSD